MAAPGIGVGDLINACLFIYSCCVKYRDAPREFNEIAEKSKALAVVLERVNKEISLEGNIVERAGDQAYSQLYDILAALRRDSDLLKALVSKYDKIHDEGPGRRAWYAIWQSNDLNDLRRRIGWHEQQLVMWQTVIVWSSHRRLEGGQEEILKAIKALSDISPSRMREIVRSLSQRDTRPLEEELRASGLRKTEIDTSIGAAVEYALADPVDQVRMSSQARSSEASAELVGKSPGSTFFVPRMEAYYGSEYPGHLDRTRTGSRDRGGKDHLRRQPPPPPAGYHKPSRAQTMADDEDFADLLKKYSLSYEARSDAMAPSPGIVLHRVGTDLNKGRRGKEHSRSRERPTQTKVVIDFDSDNDWEYKAKGKGKESTTETKPVLMVHRSKSTSAGKPGTHYREAKARRTETRDQKGAEAGPSRTKESSKEQVLVVPHDSTKSRRRSSDAPQRTPLSPLLVVPDEGPRYRPASYHTPDPERGRDHRDQVIVVDESGREVRKPKFARRPSSDQRDERGGRADGNRRRDESTHSFVRRRPSTEEQDEGRRDRESQSGRASGSEDDQGRRIRVVRRMDRIDSAGLDER